MRHYNEYIFLLTVVFFSSCFQSEVATIESIGLNIDTTNYVLASKPSPTQDSLIRKFPSLLLNNGESVVIGKLSYGCFHYYDEAITIFKMNGQYSITYKKVNGDVNHPMIIEKHLDTAASNSLSDFSKYCKFAIRNYVREQSRDSLYIGAVHKMYVTKGKETIIIPSEGAIGWDGYGMLVKRLNLEN
jgi:hypothetical protein